MYDPGLNFRGGLGEGEKVQKVPKLGRGQISPLSSL